MVQDIENDITELTTGDSSKGSLSTGDSSKSSPGDSSKSSPGDSSKSSPGDSSKSSPGDSSGDEGSEVDSIWYTFAIFGFSTGLLMIMCAIPVAWFNEQNKVKMFKLIHIAEKECVPNVSINQANPDFDHKLIHCTGQWTTT